MATHLHELYKSVTRMNTQYPLRNTSKKYGTGHFPGSVVEHVTLHLGVMGSSPTLGVD